MHTVDDLRAAVETLPRFPLAHLPTPFEHLPRFSKVLGGPQIFIKRDDCTGLAFGGNKARHNEFLFGNAIEQGADIFVWGAGVQSNNCRQTAAACAKAGIDCHLILGRGYASAVPDPIQGNLLLDQLVGAMVEIVDVGVGPELDELIAAKAEEYRSQGRVVYNWDRDTVKPLAAVSYVTTMLEVIEQAASLGFVPSALYVCSAGSTGSGLVLGRKALGLDFPIRHIAPIEWPWDTQADMTRIANQAGRLIGIETIVEIDDIDVTFDHIGPGYGLCSPQGLEAIALLARTEGILLDPTYSGKAMAGLIADIRSGRLTAGENVAFVHTGGTPALFAYNEPLSEGIAPRVFS